MTVVCGMRLLFYNIIFHYQLKQRLKGYFVTKSAVKLLTVNEHSKPVI